MLYLYAMHVNNNACLQILASVVAWSKASPLSVLAKCKSPLSDSNQRSWHYKCHALNHLAKWAERLLNRQVWEVIMARLCNGEPLPSTLHLLSSTRPRLLASPRKPQQPLRHGVSHYGSFASSPPATSDVTPCTAPLDTRGRAGKPAAAEELSWASLAPGCRRSERAGGRTTRTYASVPSHHPAHRPLTFSPALVRLCRDLSPSRAVCQTARRTSSTGR